MATETLCNEFICIRYKKIQTETQQSLCLFTCEFISSGAEKFRDRGESELEDKEYET